MTNLQAWGIIVGIASTAIAGLIAMTKFLIKHYLAELKPNSGSSLRDQVTRLEARVDTILRLLEK